jgi:threonine dehydrogenase-like Zn-dependent dehydrogenase
MNALRISSSGYGIADVPIPSIEGEALIRVTKSGICNTDLELIKGYAGFQGTIGHEFVGIVEKPANRKELSGRRVVGEINAGCGKCHLCQSGDSRHCQDRTVLGIHGRDGAHAEFLTLPEINLLTVPDSISDEEAVFIEPLAAAIGVMERLEVRHNGVAVIGDGKLGILCARAFAAAGENVELIGKHSAKLDVAKDSGINTVLLEKIDTLPKFDTIVEASGSPSGFATALELVKPRGTIVLKSTFHSMLSVDSSRIVVDEISVVGSRCGRFAAAIEMLDAGKIKVRDLISEDFPLTKAVEAVGHARKNGVLKVLLTP